MTVAVSSFARFGIIALAVSLAFLAGYSIRGMGAAEMAVSPAATPLQKTVEDFHILYHEAQGDTWTNTYWLGVRTLKLPLDLWIFQEIIHETKPDVIVEAGTFQGGSALFMASIQDAIGKGRVISIDIEDFPRKPRHDRITYLIGSSTAEETVGKVRSLIGEGDSVMVVLDSDHHAEHVLNELRIYGEMVTTGQYPHRGRHEHQRPPGKAGIRTRSVGGGADVPEGKPGLRGRHRAGKVSPHVQPWRIPDPSSLKSSARGSNRAPSAHERPREPISTP